MCEIKHILNNLYNIRFNVKNELNFHNCLN